jgi:hypothetical protein
MNMVTTGTVMPSRKEMPEPLKKNKIGEMRQGDVQSFRKNDKLVLASRDKYTVMILSIFYSRNKTKVTEVTSIYPNKPLIKSLTKDYGCAITITGRKKM